MAEMPKKLGFWLLNADYVVEGEDNSSKSVVRLWGKTQCGKTVLALDHSFKPYFYVEPSDMPKAELKLLKKRILGLEVDGMRAVDVIDENRRYLGKPRDLIKVFVRIPSDVPKFRKLIKEWDEVEATYEFGINYYKRYMIDKGISPLEWVQVQGRKVDLAGIKVDRAVEIIDIKRAARKAMPEISILAYDLEMVSERGEDRIVMASFYSNTGFKRVISAESKGAKGVHPAVNEKGLLQSISKTIIKQDPDIIVGYNTDGFDFPKMAERADRLGIELAMGRDKRPFSFRRLGMSSAAQVNGRVHIDLYRFISNIMQSTLSTEVLTLDNVSKELLGDGKTGMGWKEIESAWKSRKLAGMGEYCLKDSELALGLAEKLLPQLIEVSRVSGQLPFDSSRMAYSQLVEWLLIRKASEAGEIAPNRPGFNEIAARRKAAPYTGGYVHQPKEGIHDDIALFDFTSLYPSITITHNVSPETVDCNDCKSAERHNVPDSRHHFCGKRTGFVPAIIRELVERRREVKSRMKKLGPRSMEYKLLNSRQYALKIIANASYGYFGYAGSRWYSRICAESITAWGRHYIKGVISMAEKEGYEVIYGDTDSLFVKIKTKKEARKFLDKVNNSLPGVMELDFKGKYESGIFVLSKSGVAAKKRYALIDKEGTMTIRGFERVRRDWSELAKNTQESVLRAILRNRSPKKAVNHVRKVIEGIRKGKVDAEDLVIYSRLTKPVTEYEQIGPHVAAAKKIMSRGMEVKEGSSIAYVITKGSGSISERAEPVIDDSIPAEYDPEYYIKNQVIPAALRVLSGLGYKEGDLLSNKRLEQVSLSDFVK